MRAFASQPVLRFAPSPNGRLHLGHAYSALMNERAASDMIGRLLLRIEDLDPSRSKPEFEAAIRNDLAWLGVQFEPAVRRQSEHTEDYAAALRRLESRGLVYPCFCGRAEVARFAAGRDPDGAPIYGGVCRTLLPGDRATRLARGERVAWRLDAGAALRLVPAPILWTEFGEGGRPEERQAAPELWGDVVLKGRDLSASYHLAVTMDDAIQGVTDIVRGRDLLAATSVHRLLQMLLELPSPRYRHHRLVLDSSGAKLAKSRASRSLAELRAEGASASDIRAALGFETKRATRLTVAIS